MSTHDECLAVELAMLHRLAETCFEHESCEECGADLCNTCADAGVSIPRSVACAAEPLMPHCPSCRDECGACQRVATAEDAADITTDGRRP